DQPGSRGRTAIIMFNPRINIPPGESHYVVTSSLTIPENVDLAGIAPHAHYLGKEMKITATLHDGAEKPLICIKDWDFNGQGSYQYVKPITLQKGTRVNMEYVYDNSENNPRNPAHPPVRVHWGEQTTDEMAVTFLSVTLSPADVANFQQEIQFEYLAALLGPGASLADLPPEMSAQQKQGLALAFNLFDRNKDGKLDAEESAALIQFLRSRR